MANINIKFEIITNVAVFWYKKDPYNLCGTIRTGTDSW